MINRKTVQNTYECYLFDASDWKIGYHFGVNTASLNDGPYWEHLALEIDAVGAHPKRIVGEQFLLYIMGSRQLDLALENEDSVKYDPVGIGSLTMKSNSKEFNGSIPQTVFWQCLRTIENISFASICLTGERLKYGRARIRSIDFEKEHDPEEY